MTIDLQSQPRLRAGCRLSNGAGNEHILLIPEGLMKLAGPGRKILELCDGKNTFAEILAALQAIYPQAPRDQIGRDTASYLERLRDRGAMEF